MAEGRRQYTELTERARDEAERMTHAGRAAHDRLIADGQNEQVAPGLADARSCAPSHAESARVVDTAHAEADRQRRECDAYVDSTLAELEAGAVRRARHGQPRPQPALARAGHAEHEQQNGHGVQNGAAAHGRSGTGMDFID